MRTSRSSWTCVRDSRKRRCSWRSTGDESRGTIAFYADVRLEGWSNLPAGWAGFRALAVHSRMRGAGIGEALVRHCVQRTRDVGAETLGIHTIRC